MGLALSRLGPVTIAAALLIGSATRLYIALHPHPLRGDEASRYEPLARGLLRGEGFTLSNKPDDFDQPGYPAFIAAVYRVFGGPRAVILIQLGLELVCVWLCVLIAQIRGPVLVVALLCPFLPLFAGYLLTEILATLSMCLLVFSLLKGTARWWLIAGLASGAGLLLRADLIIASVVLPTVAVIATKQWRGLVLYSIVLILVLLPWTIRNYRLSGAIKPLGGVAGQLNDPYVNWLNSWLDDPKYLDAYWWHKDGVVDQPPVNHSAVPIRRTVMTWVRMPTYIQKTPLKIAGYIFWALLSTLAVVGATVSIRRKNYLLSALLVGLVVSRLVLPFLSALAAEPRYMIEALPACFLLAGIAITGRPGRARPAGLHTNNANYRT